MTTKKLVLIQKNQGGHWVGDGFPVRSIFTYNDLAAEVSPFLLLDYAGPADFPPSKKQRGVGAHPHRGFETVTIVYDGEVEHRDSSGAGGKIGPGDVQWMTAASGIVHEEFHSAAFSESGGRFEVIQLWVNLPREHKGADPGYQSIVRARIPSVALPDGAGTVRLIAGSYGGQSGPARTFTPINLWDLNLGARRRVELPAGSEETTAVFVIKGALVVPGGETVRDAQLAVFSREGDGISFETTVDTRLLFLNGKPLDEPIVGHGPFVMNTIGEIEQAFQDYRSGRMGRIAARER